MKLIASMIVRDEIDRYLKLVIPHLTSFCDEVRVVDDHSDDGTYEWLVKQDNVRVLRNPEPVFPENEGAARQGLFEWTLEGQPTHVLAIDADEFVSDGQRLRELVYEDETVPVWSLLVSEVWEATGEALWLRCDGGWAGGYSPILYAAPTADLEDGGWSINPRKLACGREPLAVVELARQGFVIATPVTLLHFGWASEVSRRERYLRYALNDRGEFHASAHIESIVATHGVKLESWAWPQSLDRNAIMEAIGGRTESHV